MPASPDMVAEQPRERREETPRRNVCGAPARPPTRGARPIGRRRSRRGRRPARRRRGRTAASDTGSARARRPRHANGADGLSSVASTSCASAPGQQASASRDEGEPRAEQRARGPAPRAPACRKSIPCRRPHLARPGHGVARTQPALEHTARPPRVADRPAAAQAPAPARLALRPAPARCARSRAARPRRWNDCCRPLRAERGLPGVHALRDERLREVRSVDDPKQPRPQVVVLALRNDGSYRKPEPVERLSIDEHRRVEERRAEKREPTDCPSHCGCGAACPAGRPHRDRARRSRQLPHRPSRRVPARVALETLGQRDVVGVETGDVASAASSSPRFSEEARPACSSFVSTRRRSSPDAREQRRRLVRRSVVDHDQLEVVDGLAQHASPRRERGSASRCGRRGGRRRAAWALAYGAWRRDAAFIVRPRRRRRWTVSMELGQVCSHSPGDPDPRASFVFSCPGRPERG